MTVTTQYQPRDLAWHLTCCQAHGVSVQRVSASWWSAVAHDDAGAVTFATGGQTRRHAETNALNGVNAPMANPNGLSRFFDTGPS